ncbi:MAG: sigma-54 dependent transcriptional regulator [Vicinamibacterales bacterium]
MIDSRPNILLLDDEDSLRSVVAERLRDEGFDVVEARSGEDALTLLQGFAFDVVVSDLRLPGIDGRAVIDAALERYPGIIAIVVTGFATVKDAVDVIKRGAADYVAKPFQFEELRHVITSALEQRRLKDENAYLRQQLDERFGLGAMVGRSRAMRALYQLIDTVAPTSSTVLITGETGTGKEMVARAIHQSSPRRQHRFVALNCSAIPEPLLEAELFGHVRGAFTGAIGTRMGRLEQADRGTLFLDEVGTMPAALQAKLLRVLQEREFERIGDTRTVKVDVRFVAATNADLPRMVKDGSFREDLFYRLNVVTMQLPPLSDRVEDIPLLVARFTEKLAPPGEGLEPVVVSQEAMRRLMASPWPGNVRQLENVIERALALGGGRRTIEIDDLPPELRGEPPPFTTAPELSDDGIDLPRLVSDLERHLIGEALKRTDGNRGAAARLLGLTPTTLVETLKRL